MNKDELFEFCRKWLATWTGNQPDKLIKFYTDDALYIDPANKEGLKGHDEILRYFERLLAVYEEWVWQPIEVFPIETGVIVKWKCTIPVGQDIIDEVGMDIVELDGKKITRNEVYFDRTRLIAALEKSKKAMRLSY
ncbi:MAG: nuclear transport factor 2 family protein [Candidatus Thorarchaeota archaeon]